MSGPKYGTAQVDTRRLLELMNGVNALLDDKKIEKVKNDIRTQKEKTSKLISGFKSGNVYKILEMADKKDPDNKELKHLKNILFQFDGFADDEFKYDDELVDLFVSLLNYEEKEKILLSYITQANNAAYIINKDLRLGLLSEYSNNEDKTKTLNIIKKSNDKVEKEYNLILDKSENTPFYDEIKIKMDKILGMSDMDDRFKIKRMKMFYNSYASTSSSVDEKDIEFVKLRNEYEVLCEYLNKELKSFSESDLLKKEVYSLKSELSAKKSDEYISDSLQKVMTGLGYNVVNTEVVSNKIRNVKRNYYDLSDNSVLNISESENGAVMMEVMGKHKNLTEEEKFSVKCDMDNFCPDYFRIKKELEKYGIYLENETLLEADVKYARGVDTDSFNFNEKINENVDSCYDIDKLGGNIIGE